MANYVEESRKSREAIAKGRISYLLQIAAAYPDFAQDKAQKWIEKAKRVAERNDIPFQDYKPLRDPPMLFERGLPRGLRGAACVE